MVNETPKDQTDSRARILDAARSEFAEKGFDGARVDGIAKRAEVNKALASPEVVQIIRALGADPSPLSRAAFVEHQLQERERFGGLVRDLGLKLE